MRTYVEFIRPAEFVTEPDEDDILVVENAPWFLPMLRKIDGIKVADELCQEDWGVVAFVERIDRKFWIGLSYGSEGANSWLSHVHHGSFAWLQRFSTSGRRELEQLLRELHRVLIGEAEVSEVVWFEESDRPMVHGHSSPVEN